MAGCVYGVVEGPGVFEVCGERLELVEAGGDRCLYRRGGREVLLPGCRVGVYPVPPLLYPERLTGYMMLVLPRPLALGPGEFAELCLYAEHDVAVVPPGGSTVASAVDAFPTGRGKYALYGSPSRGVLVRWLPSSVASGCSPAECRMLVRLEARSQAREAVLLHRVVWPGWGQPLLYLGCKVYGPRLRVTVLGAAAARVEVLPPKAPSGARESLGPVPRQQLSLVPRETQSFTMNMGL